MVLLFNAVVSTRYLERKYFFASGAPASFCKLFQNMYIGYDKKQDEVFCAPTVWLLRDCLEVANRLLRDC